MTLIFGDFKLASGIKSWYKLECDLLTDSDIEIILENNKHRIPEFGIAMGVPTGGLRIARLIEKYKTPDSSKILIVDDVLTTGSSVKTFIIDNDLKVNNVFVLFSRIKSEDIRIPFVSCFSFIEGSV